jgi:hypothetical protein
MPPDFPSRLVTYRSHLLHGLARIATPTGPTRPRRCSITPAPERPEWQSSGPAQQALIPLDHLRPGQLELGVDRQQQHRLCGPRHHPALWWRGRRRVGQAEQLAQLLLQRQRARHLEPLTIRGAGYGYSASAAMVQRPATRPTSSSGPQQPSRLLRFPRPGELAEHAHQHN